jgi:hypothetical protein
MTEEKLYVYGTWKVLRPDTRQYKQQSIEIEFNQQVAVEIKPEHCLKPIVVDQATGEMKLILTPEGMRFVQEQFEKLFAEAPVSEEGWSAPDPFQARKQQVEAEVGWSDADELPFLTGKAEPTKEPAKVAASDDGWGDEPVFDSKTDATEGNLPDTETWNENEEDWK